MSSEILWTSSWMWLSNKVNCILDSFTKNAVSSFRGIILPPLFGTSENAFEMLGLAWLPVFRKTLAYSSESCRGWVRWPRTWKTWGMSSGWGNTWGLFCFDKWILKGVLASVCSYLNGWSKTLARTAHL